MRAGDRALVGTLRLMTNALQQDAKIGGGDEVAVLQRERKKRVEAADAFRDAGRAEGTAQEEAEAKVIEAYLPEQLSDGELGTLVADAIDETGAATPSEMGAVMGVLMPKLAGRADGKRVSAAVRVRLGS